MTCAGITSYVIASGALDEPDAQVVGDKVQCCANRQPSTALERALGWLGKNFQVNRNPGQGLAQSAVRYYLYGLERAGRLTGRRYIGQHDWYRAGAEFLLRDQDELSGFWKGTAYGENNPHVSTSFALLFLAKGRRPVLLAKLKREPQDDWNRHRHDIDNLTRYVEAKWERELTWQIVDVEQASVDDLLQSPVLFINGRDAPKFTEPQIQNLRDYVDHGGFIFAEACCDGVEFDQGFRRMIARAFPESEYELRLLPTDHPVWQAEEKVDPTQVRPLWGIDIGCRTSVIYCPEDLSCYWELARPGRGKRLSPQVAIEVSAANAIGINVLAYATNRELKHKDEIASRQTAPKTNEQDPLERTKVRIARLKHSGGWNAAPGAVVNLQNLLARELGMRVGTDRIDISISQDQLFDYHLVFMHGRNDFRLDQKQRDLLKTFVQRGGMIMADAVCGSEAFTRAFRREMGTIFVDTPLEKIAADDEIFTPAYGGFDVTRVTRRDPQPAGQGGGLETQLREVAPDLEGIRIENRYAVVFSQYDLSCALERHESLECRGYTREDAARIAINLVLYSLHQ